MFGLVVGHPDPDRPAAIKPRPAQGVVLHHDRHGGPAANEAIARYDAAIHEFQASQALPATGWVAPLLARLASGESLGGRDRLRDALVGRGFPLL